MLSTPIAYRAQLRLGAKLLAAYNLGGVEMEFAEACAEFAAHLLTSGRSRLTVDNYARDLAQLAELAELGTLEQLQPATVLRWNDALIERGMSSRSRARKLSALRSFVAWARDYRLLERDPVPTELSVPPALHLPHALSEAEVGAILNAAEPVEGLAGVAAAQLARDRAVLEVLYASGMRVSELCGLTLLDLHLGEGFAFVTGKGNKQRLVPLGQHAIAALQRWLPLRGELCAKAGGCAEVFLSRRGPISRSAVFRLIKDYAAAAGVRSVSPHTFRHSCASHMLAHGADLRLVQELLGHAALSTTQIYTHIEKSRLRSVYDASHPLA